MEKDQDNRGRRRGGESAEDVRGRNLLRPAILVLLKEQASHGYELVSRLEEVGFGPPDFGGLYRTLRAMEEDGLVASAWGTAERGPARRIYRVTEAGEEYMRDAAQGLVNQRRVIGALLDRYRDKVRKSRSAGRRLQRVLVVEDNDDLRHALWILLERRGWLVDEAVDGATGLEQAATRSPDVVVLDYRLPGLSGLDVARRLREEGFTKPMVLYSAYLTPELEDEAALLGLRTMGKTEVDDLMAMLDDLRNEVGRRRP